MSEIRLLLADDYRPLLESVFKLLEPGFEIVGEAQNGRALVEAALKLKPDVIVTDISMPILNGIEAAKRLREAGSTSKIVFLTVILDRDFISTCRGAGVCRKSSAWKRSGACHPRGCCGANLHFTGSGERELADARQGAPERLKSGIRTCPSPKFCASKIVFPATTAVPSGLTPHP